MSGSKTDPAHWLVETVDYADVTQGGMLMPPMSHFYAIKVTVPLGGKRQAFALSVKGLKNGRVAREALRVYGT